MQHKIGPTGEKSKDKSQVNHFFDWIQFKKISKYRKVTNNEKLFKFQNNYHF
jgi:hypothetical protein